MTIALVNFLDRLDRNGSPPRERLGYIAPSAGTFTLDGRGGHAHFVWYHEDLVVDWHDHEMKFAGTVSEGNVSFWCYRVSEHSHDHGGGEEAQHDHGDHEGLYFLFADRRTNSDQASDSDEGFRIFYGIHNELHLLAWDARTFSYHRH